MTSARLPSLPRQARWFVLTGAGVSAESGIPTFRSGPAAIWKNYSLEDLATPEGFRRNPTLVWEWYVWRRQLVRQAQPNPAHEALAELERLVEAFLLATQNVDGLHQRAGSRNVVELHGNILRNDCTRCDWTGPVDEELLPPHCPRCGSLVRPGVVWFGEPLPAEPLRRAQGAALECDVCLVVGTSAVVEPAASLPRMAKMRGALLIEVNPEPTPLTPRADVVLAEPASTALPRLLAAVQRD